MAKYKFSNIQRMAIWEAHNKKCAYCNEPTLFKDFQVDHILPESLLGNADELEKIKIEYGLGSEFHINSYYNWLPSCSQCNRTKSNKPFSESSARFFIESVAKPQYDKVIQIEKNLQTTVKEEGFITKSEAFQLIQERTEESIKDLVVNNLIISPATERRDKWIDGYLAEAYQLITEKVALSVVQNLPNNELFITVVLQATSIAIRNHQNQKLEALRNGVVNSVLTSSVNDDAKLLFIDLVDQLKASQLNLLFIIYEADEDMAKKIDFLKELENQRQLYSCLIKQLIDRNLISLRTFFNNSYAIVQEEDESLSDSFFQLPPYRSNSRRITPSLLTDYYTPTKRMNIKLRDMEKESRDIDLVIQIIKDNKSKDCKTEFGSLFIEFIKSPTANS